MISASLELNTIVDSDRNSGLIGRVVARSAVHAPLTDRLYELFAQFYLQVDRARFEQDQSEKDWVILLCDPGGVVHGFTTLKLYEIELLGRKVRAVFSGNTIIDCSAIELGCGILWSEDFAHGQRYGIVAVRNPFR